MVGRGSVNFWRTCAAPWGQESWKEGSVLIALNRFLQIKSKLSKCYMTENIVFYLFGSTLYCIKNQTQIPSISFH